MKDTDLEEIIGKQADGKGIKISDTKIAEAYEKLKIHHKLCIICQYEFKLEELISIDHYENGGCKHNYCEGCLHKWISTLTIYIYIATKYEDQNASIETVMCSDPDCMEKGNRIWPEIIQAVDKELFKKLDERYIERECKMFSCFHCNQRFDIRGVLGRNITCIGENLGGCSKKTCRLCKENSHEGKCDDALRRNVYI